ncbi:MAG: hypothetical protein HBSAPP03_17620 [Phycisphaerae bacterium]|nr:MAG: hypothetical protein HBSAPP03_17620 [Phycisphaerae bacterium]
MDQDIDALVEASQNGVNKTAEQSLWRTVLNLREWYFVARGAGDDAEPVIGALEGKSALLVFTDEERAAMFAKRRNMRASDARGSARDAGSMEGMVLTMDVPDALAYCEDLANAGVEWALFNNGGYSFQCSLIDLKGKAAQYKGR